MVPQDSLETWGWRVPFLCGMLIGPVGLYIRTKMQETPEFAETTVVSSPVTRTFTRHLDRVMSAAAVVGFASISVYLIISMPTFAVKNLDLPGYAGYLSGIISGVVALVGAPYVGKLADRVGCVRVMTVTAAVALLLGWPLFKLLVGNRAIYGVDVLHIWPDSVEPVGVVTFNVVGHDPGLVAAYLAAEHGIGVRDGRFCAHPLLERLGAPNGAVRASVGVGTELEAVERLISAVHAYLTSGLTAHYVVVDGCWAIADDPRRLIQVRGLLGLAAQAAACTSTTE